jgi:hypothetical protein
MRHIAIWHCYWHAPDETYVMVAETKEALLSKVRDTIVKGWSTEGEGEGPLPEDFGDLCYTVIDSTLCEPVGDEA